MTRNLRMALADRVLVADGGMGTMLQGRDLTLADFQGLEGCNEILNVTRPDVVADIHRAYFAAGADCVETNTFGANLSALGEYDAADRIVELAEAGARIARAEADAASTPDRPRFVLGSMGPGTKLPSLLHVSYAQLRDAYQAQAEAMISGGVDAFQIETCQDLLQTKAAINGARRAQQRLGADLPIFANVTIETSGTMLLGSEIGAALTSLGALGIEAIGLNCGTGPTEMSEHLRHLARHTDLPLVCMPNAGLPELTADGARYPMGPTEFVDYVSSYAKEFQLGLVGGCCGTTPAHISALAAAVAGRQPEPRAVPAQSAVSSLYVDVPLRQDTAYLSIGERTNANGSKAFREAMLVENWDDCVDIAKQQSRDGAHLLDLCVDYVGRDGVADMSRARVPDRPRRWRCRSCSTPPSRCAQAPAWRASAGRCAVNSVNFEDGDGPGLALRQGDAPRRRAR